MAGNDAKKVVIVTGSTSGIGLATARYFGQKGWRVVVNGRNAERVQQVTNALQQEGIEAIGIAADIQHRAQAQLLIDETLRQWGRLDCLVNNAGITMRALFEEAGPEVLERVMQVNFWGTVYCTHAALPHLRATRGAIVGVSSIAGYVGLPARTGYSASKFAMNGFLEALRIELRPTGVHVAIVAPGFTATNIRYRALTEKGTPQQMTPLDEQKADRPEHVAAAIYKAVTRRKREVILTTEGKLTVWFKKCLPAVLEKLVYRRFLNEPDSPLQKYLK